MLKGGQKITRPVTEGANVSKNQPQTSVAKSKACSLPFIDPNEDSLDRLTVECELRRPFPQDWTRAC